MSLVRRCTTQLIFGKYRRLFYCCCFIRLDCSARHFLIGNPRGLTARCIVRDWLRALLKHLCTILPWCTRFLLGHYDAERCWAVMKIVKIPYGGLFRSELPMTELSIRWSVYMAHLQTIIFSNRNELNRTDQFIVYFYQI